ncbi:hypothetical protein HC028_18725 [Planosporangium flavigriseum]|uniref:Uncharacterized protein n=1 Tax=Planosporangium flavigriseum TaxID=373681 RepID=A0A8J3LYF5_9ACTN|nr:hypothetical protein [Planosporangium flavigriseum]NJC66524.1 hypothetical protein [Planosporangium flavigriseum]GIG73395.1 hypothetical protein Pfl04_17990 [Planosporangium flavigriseum]
MSASTSNPIQRNPGEVATAGTYRRSDPIWVYRSGTWQPGVVEAASSTAVMATYRCGQGRGTAVDTMSVDYVRRRAEIDPQLDRTPSGPATAA